MKPWIPILALGLALSPLLVLHPVRVSGPSMEPTLHSGELRLVLRSWAARNPQRGEVWLAKGPEGAVLKRVIGLPGEQVEQREGWLFIHDTRLQEPYVQHPESDSQGPWPCGEGYLVMGDNRTESRDGRTWGSLPRQALLGRVLNP